MATNDTGGGLTMHRGRDLLPEERRKATRYVALQAHDADDCAHLLAMLGLHPTEGLNG